MPKKRTSAAEAAQPEPPPAPPAAVESPAIDLAEYETQRAFSNVKWRKVTAPKPWRPKPGDELVGFFVGRGLRTGPHGDYETVTVRTPRRGSFTITGQCLLDLIEAEHVVPETPVRIVFRGAQQLDNGHTWKEFELYVPKGQ